MGRALRKSYSRLVEEFRGVYIPIPVQYHVQYCVCAPGPDSHYLEYLVPIPGMDSQLLRHNTAPKRLRVRVPVPAQSLCGTAVPLCPTVSPGPGTAVHTRFDLSRGVLGDADDAGGLDGGVGSIDGGVGSIDGGVDSISGGVGSIDGSQPTRCT